jgi:hypothetical protein
LNSAFDVMRDPVLEGQLAEFVGKYTPEIAASIQACRTKMHSLFPRGYEFVYDNYNALVFGFGASERPSEAVLSLAAYPRWLTLFFLNGAALDDPDSLLEGCGSRVRSIRVKSPDDLDAAKVRALIAQAMASVDTPLAKAPLLCTILKSVSAKQRPRRPGESKARVSRAVATRSKA